LTRWIWIWGPAVAQMAVIFALSSWSGVPDLPGGLTGYTGHFTGYGLLGALVLRGFAGARWKGVTWPAAWRALALSPAYGVTDEFHQSFVEARTPTMGDWVADTLGAAMGIALVMLAARASGRSR
jgi:VanZ family protein